MRQAIEEGFILDVLANYTTYKAYWSLLKKIKDDPRYDRKKATALLRSFVDLHQRDDREEGRDHGRPLRRARPAPDRRQGQGHDRHPLPAPRRALQARGRRLPQEEGLSVQGPGRVLGHGEGRRDRLHRGQHERVPRDPDRRDLQAGRVPVPDRRQQVPDRVRPAAAAHDVRGQEAGRRERGADPVAAQPGPPGQGGHLRPGLRQRGRGDPERLRALLRPDAAERGHRPEPALRPPDQAGRVPPLHGRGGRPLRRAATSTPRPPRRPCTPPWPRPWTATRRRRRRTSATSGAT